MSNQVKLIDQIAAHPSGISAAALERALGLSRSTLVRMLRLALAAKEIRVAGAGPATRYFPGDPTAAIRRYFEQPYDIRKVARYDEGFLAVEPGLSRPFSPTAVPALHKKELTTFLIDFACASAMLEGGTYSLLDTQVLLEYGQHNPDKPLEEAFLVLNHRDAFEYLFDHPSLDSILRIHDLLTNDHGKPELTESRHFLGSPFRGTVREHEDVNIGLSAYSPPFRPGTGYIGKMLDTILARAADIPDPVGQCFYLLTRIPYLQPFRDGNKRTARALCNVPLLQAGLPPISFVDFDKRDYVVAMHAIYELRDVSVAEHMFLAAYDRSIQRLTPHR